MPSRQVWVCEFQNSIKRGVDSKHLKCGCRNVENVWQEQISKINLKHYRIFGQLLILAEYGLQSFIIVQALEL